MLGNKMVYPTLPVVDISRARKFYEDKLGLKVLAEDQSPGLVFGAGKGTLLYIYQRGQTKADHTVVEFEVDDIEAEVKELRSRGVQFEEYDMPEMGIKTVDGIASMGDMKGAWFKDTEGNILALGETTGDLKEKIMAAMSSAQA